jgi:hypothetical protein
MNQMETMTALMDLSFALLLAALAVAPNLIRVYRELRAQVRQGGQHNSSALLASCPPVPFNFPPMSLQALSTDNRVPRSGKGRAAQLVHQVSDWCSGAAANFGWMREAKRENTRCGL